MYDWFLDRNYMHIYLRFIMFLARSILYACLLSCQTDRYVLKQIFNYYIYISMCKYIYIVTSCFDKNRSSGIIRFSSFLGLLQI